MDFSEVVSRVWYATKETFKQVASGGWVEIGANISKSVTIGSQAVVCKSATIKGGTIEGGTIWSGTIWGGTIWGGTIWGGTIEGGTIEGGTIWGGTIKGGTIWGGTIKGGTIEGGTIKGGTIEGGTIKGGTIKGGTIKGGTIWGGTWKHAPLSINGTKYVVSVCAYGKIAIGCQVHTASVWKKSGSKIGKDAGFTDLEMEEYSLYLKFCYAWMKLHNCEKPE